MQIELSKILLFIESIYKYIRVHLFFLKHAFADAVSKRDLQRQPNTRKNRLSIQDMQILLGQTVV